MQKSEHSINNLEQCMKCTICTAYCPVIQVNPIFPGPKHGGPDTERLRLKNKVFFDENLKYCMNCKRCEVACPSDVRIADIIHSARMDYSLHIPGLRDRLLANTDFLGKISAPVAPLVNMITGNPIAKTLMHGLLGIHKSRTFPKYKREGFISWFKKNKLKSQGEFKEKISFFHGCSTEYQHPEIGKAFVEVLNAFGIGVELLDEKCCGVAMISNGLFKSALKNARHNINVFKNAAKPIVSVSTTCTLTIRDEYKNILRLDNSDIKDDFIIVEKFLYELISSEKVKTAFLNTKKQRIAYHVPCHMRKLGWSIYTKKILSMIPNVEIIEMDNLCCGIAGTYGFKKENYEKSQQIGSKLFKQIEETNPDLVACECETCKWQIEMSTGFGVINPIVILYSALDLDKTRELNKK